MLPALYAMRILVEGLISSAEAEARQPTPPPPADGACPHPAERQMDATVLGGPSEVICLVCGRQRPGVAP